MQQSVISPGRRAHSSKPAAAACGGRLMGRTDGQTDGRSTVSESLRRILWGQCQQGRRRSQTPPPVLLPGSYFKRPKSSPVLPFACNWYYCAQFTAKPKAACALRFSWAATSSNLGLRGNMTSSIKPEVRNISLRRQKSTEPRPQVICTRNLVKIGRLVPNI